MTRDEAIKIEMKEYLTRRYNTRDDVSKCISRLLLYAAYYGQYWTYAKLCRVEYFALLQLAAFHGFACEREL